MKISHLTFTGADESVDPVDLGVLSALFPFIEWAILFSESREGTPRYPGQQWKDEFYRVAPHAARAVHLCGSEMLTNFAFPTVRFRESLQYFQRIQLNFNAQRLDPQTLDLLVTQWKSGYWHDKDGHAQEVITQHNQNNADVYRRFEADFLGSTISNAILFDGSGGEGKSPAYWPSPLPGHPCGYAGGLGPDNIIEQLQSISDAVASPDTTVWIDMESKVRTDEKFDLDKVGAVIDAVLSDTTIETGFLKFNSTQLRLANGL